MIIRTATRNDVPLIVALLANDPLGQKREDLRDPLPEGYYDAYDKIERDSNQHLVVIDSETEGVLGTLQLSFIQYLTYRGGIRAQIEAVRVRHDQRGKGIGEQLFVWAIQEARQRGAHVVQLTTDKQRPGALAFYEKLGFEASHEGMKLHL